MRRAPRPSAQTVKPKEGSPRWDRSANTLLTALTPNELTPSVAKAATDRKGATGWTDGWFGV
ncbi:hypothetical protein Ppa06_46560 [Planomonospora parontospora subsp. parontospora]|uniref:Uncharacterized protein n=2 Tax=Planomonospora parontospora TaxID=58119 RepID=A0AA37F6R8_9ACTN|nr:hypothetical protein GCM10010126_51970 [Planomonospora parontospora]GII10858.1 hypothetical protein Ppa06_46560 [Planomonospora parontospora subsp. parontospora]